MAFKGFFKPKNESKYMGSAKNIVYRSGWEFKYMMQLDHDPNVKQWASEEIIIKYLSPVDKRQHRYFPDFYVEYTDGRRELIEVKPMSQVKQPKIDKKKSRRKLINELKTWEVNQSKWAYAQEWCKQNGVTFKVLTERELFPKVSRTRK